MKLSVDQIKEMHDYIATEARAIAELEQSGKRCWWRKQRLERRIAKFQRILKAANAAIQ